MHLIQIKQKNQKKFINDEKVKCGEEKKITNLNIIYNMVIRHFIKLYQ